MARVRQTRLAGIALVLAAAASLVLAQESLQAARCQEECDAELSACYDECDFQCEGYDETCRSPCRLACEDPYWQCTFGAISCGGSFWGACIIHIYWHNGIPWYWYIEECASYPI